MPKRNRHRESLRAERSGPGGDERAPAPATGPPDGVRWVRTRAEAAELASLLLGELRWPVAVITIASGTADPYIDATALKAQVGDLAEVAVMPTSDVSWGFSDVMPDKTQVFGGAGRVYGVDGSWRSDPYRSPLRFAYSTADSERVVRALARDVAAFALETHRRSPAPAVASPRRAATVQGLVGDSRAMLVLDDGSTATLWAELTVPGVPIERIVTPGQPLSGDLDHDARRFDVRAAVRRPLDALAGYQVGSTVLARVDVVGPESVTLTVFPGMQVVVPREQITDNPLDRASDLFTAGEVVLATVASLGVRPGSTAALALRLDLVDDDTDAEPAPALLEGGPPWLELAPLGHAVTPVRPESAPGPASGPAEPATGPRSAPAAHDSAPPPEPAPAPPPAQVRPSPVVHPDLPAPRAAPAEVTSSELSQVRRRAQQLERDLHQLRDAHRALAVELATAERERTELKTKLREAGAGRRKALRSASRTAGAGAALTTGPQFTDPEEQFRFEVHHEWVMRIPAAQKHERPLATYEVGPRFLSSIQELQGVDPAKVVAVVVEVLTGIASEQSSREVHPLRTHDSGGAPAFRREDGATCMRATLQRSTPAARRLHYWKRGEAIELSRVVQHDDLNP